MAAICLGVGEDAAPPSVELLLRFAGGVPPLYGSNGCTRSIDPDTDLAVVHTTEGAPALFVGLTDAPDVRGPAVLVRVEKTGWLPFTVRCRVEMGVLGQADERHDDDARRGTRSRAAPPPPELLRLGDPSAVTWRIRGC